MNRGPLFYFLVTLGAAAVVIGGFVLQLWLVQDLPDGDLSSRAAAWVGAICAIAILSYVYKENPVYRTFEHILLGLGLGFGIAITIQQVLIEKWWIPMFAAMKAFYHGHPTPRSWWDICLIFSALFGLLWYCQYSKKYLWLSRITIGVTAGAGAGLGIKNVAITTLPQITSTFKNVAVSHALAPSLGVSSRFWLSFENLLFLAIVCCVLYYFFFSFRRESAVAKAPATLGRFFLMISFGAFFGNTFMSRVVILIERVHFLIHSWLMVQ